jgi:predicted nucleotidyltransferase
MNLGSCNTASGRKNDKSFGKNLQNFLKNLLPPIHLFICMQAVIPAKYRKFIECSVVDQRSLQSMNHFYRVTRQSAIRYRKSVIVELSVQHQSEMAPTYNYIRPLWLLVMTTEFHKK